ncbi:MAG: secondary thiamine-phosphate synthase enzyme YjbQ [Thaumarchaeota archaeon]|nr:secondary thiamine-phosphate synthase enzyme YjbQ [Nitrososphaerota archaeon]
MTVKTRRLQIRTEGENSIIDLSSKVQKEVEASGLTEGIVTVFVPGSTGALTTMEYEPGLKQDFPTMLETVSPRDKWYEHENTWHDHNGHSHVRASLVGASLTIPFEGAKLLLGTWQQVVFIECDIRPREREIILQIMGQ